MWTKAQALMFAKQIASSDIGASWKFLVPRVRDALLDSKVMSVVFSQRAPLEIEHIRQLRAGISAALRNLGYSISD
jgi:hypothetical protein